MRGFCRLSSSNVGNVPDGIQTWLHRWSLSLFQDHCKLEALGISQGGKKKKKDGGNVFWHQKIYSQKHLNHKTQEKEISDFKCLKK